VSVARVDKELPLPKYETPQAAAFDFITREDTRVAAGSVGLVPSNLVVKVPRGYALLVVPRSSTPRKKGLSIPHGIGIIDNDYCGPDDEIKIQVYNFSGKDVVVRRSERIAQGVLVKTARADFKEGLKNYQSRGGFGSTG